MVLLGLEMVAATYVAKKQIFDRFKTVKKNQKKKSTKHTDETQKSLQKKSVPVLMTRHQQLQAMAVIKDKETLKQEKILHQNFIVAISSLGIATTGWLFYPPLSILSLPGIIYSFRYIYLRAYYKLRQKKLNIDVSNATVISLLLFKGYFIFTCLPILFAALRRKLVAKVKDDSKSSIIDVFKQQPQIVTLLTQGVETQIPIEEVTTQSILVVNAGETVPADALIINGQALIDQHILTGEGVPVEKKVGDKVFALTVVLSGRIDIQVEKTGAETTAAHIGKVLNKTVNIKTNMQLQSEKNIDTLVPPVLLTGLIGLPFLGVSNIAGLINSLPGDNLMIAASVNTLNYLNLASKHGILIKDGRTLELLNQIDTLVFDKTGTLTEEVPRVGTIHTFYEYEAIEILRLAASAERYQHHPIAKAIMKAAEEQGLDLLAMDNAQYNVSLGLTVDINNTTIHIGSYQFMNNLKLVMPKNIEEIEHNSRKHGFSLVFVATIDSIVGIIEIHPRIRSEAKTMIQKLSKGSIKEIYIISGDQEMPTAILAKKLGIDNYFSEVMPERKADLVAQLQSTGKKVCFVGDGINDSIALKKSHVSISFRGASTVATDTAQIILMDGSLNQLNQLFDLAYDFKHKMNFTNAAIFIPNILGIGLIAFFHTGFLTSIIMNQTGLLCGMSYSTFPLLKTINKANSQSKQVKNN